ncbi:MAG: 23S rRNA (guanosine(2251)-2'-O)-methyltransferase RlmB [Candidatus Azobacteroides sp.]|nr:23S rRNA (guanosine(2251)-2'-O)-methyltransferase RlmB [Candidatus Azobacteroides sp.]
MEKNEVIFGIRAVIEAIQAGKDIDKIFIKKDLQGELSVDLFRLIRENKILSQRVPVEKLNRITRKNHQGVIAFISAVPYQKIEDIIPALFEEGKNPFVVILDGITDVRNFGAIARTCECAGVNAIVIPEKGSVSINADAIKTSAGALLSLPVCREKNLTQAIKFLKDSGVHIVVASEKGDKIYREASYSDPVAILMGAEDTGVDPERLRISDEIVSIPQFGVIGSLNVSVAAGILLYEVVRNR